MGDSVYEEEGQFVHSEEGGWRLEAGYSSRGATLVVQVRGDEGLNLGGQAWNFWTLSGSCSVSGKELIRLHLQGTLALLRDL